MGCACVEVTLELIYRAAPECARCWARNNRGHVRELPMSRWIGSRILLTDDNVGIGGDPVRTLRRAAELLAPGGMVIAEIDLPSVNSGHELLRWETKHYVGQWFPWSRVNAATLDGIAGSAEFLIISTVEINARVVAVLRGQPHPRRC